MPELTLEKSTDSVLAIIMGGGQGSRLYPLTHNRSKPAVPLAAKCRIVDIPISNCINSGIRKMYVLTQYNSESLNRHVTSAYRFDHYGDNFVHILAAQQTPGDDKWYQGTADAVRQNLAYFLERPYKYFLILSGDQLYRMDFRLMLRQHLKSNADVTIATTPVTREPARAFGLIHTDEHSRITEFVEKPGSDDALLDKLAMPQNLLEEAGIAADEERFQASMGIYIFNRAVLEEALANDAQDFGKHI
ncbi:MAG TPA: sugar phosphate nucleotidyltransferase, partial [Bacteroidia bacterium]|nr:sugar phosphate nucleotidyltransferase [Bacteroidia bacterium]